MSITVSKTPSEFRIIGSVLLVATLFLSAVTTLLTVSKQELHCGLQEINEAELTELARQIALTLDASLDPAALANPPRMQQIVERNMASRLTNAGDNLLLEIRIHAPDSTSSVGYRAIAGSAPHLIGQESDPEDIEAIRKGELVVLNETRNGATILDITCPLHSNGKTLGTAGIKMSMQQGFALIDEITADTIRSLRWTAALTLALAGGVGLMMALSLLRSNAIRKRLVKDLREQAATDELTGLCNRRKLMEIAHGELKRAVRFNHPLTIALLDIDRFKHINDEYGHTAGDKALVIIANLLQTTIRETDIAARLGGDEFMLVLPETTALSAFEVLERCRATLAAGPIDLGTDVSITLSVGIASLCNAQETLDTLMERADKALYRAKNAGRNQVVIEE